MIEYYFAIKDEGDGVRKTWKGTYKLRQSDMSRTNNSIVKRMNFEILRNSDQRNSKNLMMKYAVHHQIQN